MPEFVIGPPAGNPQPAPGTLSRRKKTVTKIALASVPLLAAWLTGAAGHAADTRVDVALVLAADVSGSMTEARLATQRDGFAGAFRNPALLDAIHAGIHRRIAVTYVEWAGSDEHWLVAPWTVIDDAASAEAFATRLSTAARERGRNTSLSAGLLFAAAQFASLATPADRMTIDLSGDGPNNAGPPVAAVRDLVVGHGITVNGLPIAPPPPVSAYAEMQGPRAIDLAAYFAACVIGGAGSFTMPIAGPGQLFAAIQRKLVLEIAEEPAHFILAGFTPGQPANADCETAPAPP
jgi:hypothetical protein